MANVLKIPFGGREVEAVEVEFDIKREDWNEYALVDGGKVRVKTVVQKVYRVLDPEGKPARDAQGDPQIVVKHNTQIVASD